MMILLLRLLVCVLALTLITGTASAQIDDICREFGATPSLDAPILNAPFIYGRIIVNGVGHGAKPPKVTVTFSDRGQPSVRLTVDKSGNYCFKRISGDGSLVVDVDGVEHARRTVASFGPAQQREDFEINVALERLGPPTVISAKFSHPQTERTRELYRKAADAEKSKDAKGAVEYMKEVVSLDPADFIAWAKLGSLYFEQNLLGEAESAFKKSLELRVEYTPAWIYAGRIRVAQKHYDIAIEIFKQAIQTDATSSRAYQLLGEAYLQVKKGSLGAEALNKAIELDPNGMAECHLLLARLYDLAGAKPLASREYKLFLAKVPDYPDKKKFEKYIKDNPADK